MFNAICSIAPQPDYRLRLTYSDGETVTADFTSVVQQGGIFAPLADPAFFAQASLDERGRVVQWPGELEFCADALRQQARENTFPDADL